MTMATYLRAVRANGVPEVDRDVLRLLADCTADLVPQHTELVLALHQRLLERAPALVQMVGSGRPACQRLVAAVLHAATPGQPWERAEAAVRQVGADNYLEGFPTDQHGSVTHALLHAVRGVFRGEWSSALSSVWVEYLMWFRSQLLSGVEAQRATATPEDHLIAPIGGPSLPLDAAFDQDEGDGSLMAMTLHSKRGRRTR
jgi:hemoglobin-like flavoprotein